MADLDAFLPLAQSGLDGCLNDVLRDAVRDASIQFMKETQLLTNDIKVNVRLGKKAYTLSPPDGLAWIVENIQRDGEDLDETNRDDYIDAKMHAETAQPTAYYIEGDGRLILGPIPEADEQLTGIVTVRPSDDATDLPDVLYTDWRRAIAAGARVFVRENFASWDDPAKEAKDRAIFESAINDAQKQRNKGRTRKRRRVVGQFF